MTVDRMEVLAGALDLAKQFLRLSSDGTVEILQLGRLGGKAQILLYLIGKMYAHEAGLAATSDVGNSELLEQLRIPEGSLYPWLKTLRDKNRITQSRRGKRVLHSIPTGLVEETLLEIERALAENPPT